MSLVGHCIRHPGVPAEKVLLSEPTHGHKRRGRRQQDTFLDTMRKDAGLESTGKLRMFIEDWEYWIIHNCGCLGEWLRDWKNTFWINLDLEKYLEIGDPDQSICYINIIVYLQVLMKYRKSDGTRYLISMCHSFPNRHYLCEILSYIVSVSAIIMATCEKSPNGIFYPQPHIPRE